MSKIAKALAKAKKQRQKFSSRDQTSDVRSSVDALRLDLQKLSYSQTKSIRLNNMTLESNRLHTLIDNALAVDRYNLLCTQILQATRTNGRNTLMVTSCIEGEARQSPPLISPPALPEKLNTQCSSWTQICETQRSVHI